jgi:hypothetical protein
MFALFLLLAAILFWWVTYKFTIYALPCFAGVVAGQCAFDTGAGWVGAFIVWAVTALVAFQLMRLLYASTTLPPVRILLALCFVAPSGVFGYFLFDDLSADQIPSEVWRQALCD